MSDLDSQPGRETLGTLSLPLAPLGHTFQVGRDSLRAALDATVLSRTGRAAGVDDQGRVLGITTYERLRAAIQTAEQAGLDGTRTSRCSVGRGPPRRRRRPPGREPSRPAKASARHELGLAEP